MFVLQRKECQNNFARARAQSQLRKEAKRWKEKKGSGKPPAKTVDINKQAPAFKIKASDGKVIDLAQLTKKGPVLVRLTCGCSGCEKELAYFQTLHKAYKGIRPNQSGDFPRTGRQSRKVRQEQEIEYALCC